jgi:hypothetical protein
VPHQHSASLALGQRRGNPCRHTVPAMATIWTGPDPDWLMSKWGLLDPGRQP